MALGTVVVVVVRVPSTRHLAVLHLVHLSASMWVAPAARTDPTLCVAGRHPWRNLLEMTNLDTAPVQVDPELDGDHERMSHIVLEGVKINEDDFVSAGPSVVEGMVNGTAVKALCGKVWVPGRDPKRYPLCPTCKDIAEARGWKVPIS